jgi:hypothetical protein
LAIKDTLLQDKNGINVYDLTYASPKEGRVTAYLIVPPGKGPFARNKLEAENYFSRQPVAKPDFSGTWQFNRRKSSLQIPPPDSTIFTIEHHEPRFHLARTHVFAGKSDTFSIDLTTDGETVVRDHGNMKIYVRLYWEGETLVFDSKLEREGEKATNVVRYKLADDEQTFIAEERFHSEQRSYENTWVFDRR